MGRQRVQMATQHFPRNLLKAAQAETEATHDLTVDDAIHARAAHASPRARIVALRGLVARALAGDTDLGPLVEALDSLDAAVAGGLQAMGARTSANDAEAALLGQVAQAYEWVRQGLAHMRLYVEAPAEERLTEGLGQVEQAVARIDRLLSPQAPSLSVAQGLLDACTGVRQALDEWRQQGAVDPLASAIEQLCDRLDDDAERDDLLQALEAAVAAPPDQQQVVSDRIEQVLTQVETRLRPLFVAGASTNVVG